ncbi:calcium-binding protein [Paracoccus zhejiangensis]|uniref:Calcium-binding protein n=1 Tax=Paracoccus zhejiangensis TaxID=1077935 RepID=A0A2H5F0T5_9RHOB|nr:calcium-binding protein [Paracoccus zhejiangensis]AUH65169.1 hypothetical protein CX676_14140 [Paracoccus zhejiangensis]
MAEYRLDPGYSIVRAIDYASDRDSFSTALINGLTYSMRVSGAYSGGGSLADPNLTLTDYTGRVLGFNDDISNGVNRDSLITFTARQTATYNLIVGEQGNNATGSYKLILTPGFATNANDNVGGTGYADAVNGMAGNDVLRGNGGNDMLFGGTGNDTLMGGIGNDRLIGDAGNDLLRGESGNDRLIGGDGGDRLIGAAGADVFDFDLATDSDAGGVDVIAAGDGATAFQGVGVAGGDLLDISGIDANEYLSGNQAFTWSLSKTAGTAYLVNSNGNTVLYAHTDNDGSADFAVIIADGTGIDARDYISSDFLL